MKCTQHSGKLCCCGGHNNKNHKKHLTHNSTKKKLQVRKARRFVLGQKVA